MNFEKRLFYSVCNQLLISKPPGLFLIICALLFFSLVACSEEYPGLPDHIANSEHLLVFDKESITPKQFHFHRETVFEDSLHIDQIKDIKVDDDGRLYIASESWGRRQLHLFESDGSYIDSLGMMGTEPGEFQSIDHIQVIDETLFLSDESLQRVTIYNRYDFSLIDTLTFHQEKFPFPDGLTPDLYRLSPFAILDNESHIILFRQIRNPAYEPEGLMKIYLLETDGGIRWTKLAEMPDLTWLVGDYAGSPAAFTLHLPEQSLHQLSTNNRLITAHTSEFLITSRSINGDYVKFYYLPLQSIELHPSEINHPRFSHNNQVLRVRESAVYPEYWPALYSIVPDNANRIWVSTIPENRDRLDWWVIDEDSGELVTRFAWPFERPIVYVKGNSVYTVEKDGMGFERVVRYRFTEVLNGKNTTHPEIRMSDDAL